jgi:hypothetical protein
MSLQEVLKKIEFLLFSKNETHITYSTVEKSPTPLLLRIIKISIIATAPGSVSHKAQRHVVKDEPHLFTI